MAAITGNTYPVREQMREMGGTWDKGQQAWIVPDSKAEAARALVAAQGPKRGGGNPAFQRRARRRSYSGSGYSGYQYTDSRGSAHFGAGCGCEDYPCCGH